MQIPGHLAVAAVQYRLICSGKQYRQTFTPLLLATLFPDVVDKFIGYIWRVMPNGRHYAHNLFSLFGLSALVTLIWGQTAGRAWFTGYLGHLLADTHSLVPWLFPLKKYPFQQGQLRFEPDQLVKEMIFLAVVLMLLRQTRSSSR